MATCAQDAQMVGASELDTIETPYAHLYDKSPWLQPAIEWIMARASRYTRGSTYLFPLTTCFGGRPTGPQQNVSAAAPRRPVRRHPAAHRHVRDLLGLRAYRGRAAGHPFGKVSPCVRAPTMTSRTRCLFSTRSRKPAKMLAPLIHCSTCYCYCSVVAPHGLDARNCGPRLTCRTSPGRRPLTSAVACPPPCWTRLQLVTALRRGGLHLRHHFQSWLGRQAAGPSVINRMVHEIEAGRVSLLGLGRIEGAFRRIDRGSPLLR